MGLHFLRLRLEFLVHHRELFVGLLGGFEQLPDAVFLDRGIQGDGQDVGRGVEKFPLAGVNVGKRGYLHDAGQFPLIEQGKGVEASGRFADGAA